MKLERFRQRPVQVRPSTEPGWVKGAYGLRAEALVSALPGLMEAATDEASIPSAPESTDGSGRTQHQRGLLWDDLRDLRSVLIDVNVCDDDVDRDRRLRAALGTAIGAAASLALASASQPTAGYLRLTRLAVDEVLSAAGELGPTVRRVRS